MSGINLVHFPFRTDLSNEYSHHALFFSVGRLVTNLTSQYNTLVVIRMYQTNVSKECINLILSNEYQKITTMKVVMKLSSRNFLFHLTSDDFRSQLGYPRGVQYKWLAMLSNDYKYHLS